MLEPECTFQPLNFGTEGIKQHILDVLNERRRHVRKGRDYTLVSTPYNYIFRFSKLTEWRTSSQVLSFFNVLESYFARLITLVDNYFWKPISGSLLLSLRGQRNHDDFFRFQLIKGSFILTKHCSLISERWRENQMVLLHPVICQTSQPQGILFQLKPHQGMRRKNC